MTGDPVSSTRVPRDRRLALFDDRLHSNGARRYDKEFLADRPSLPKHRAPLPTVSGDVSLDAQRAQLLAEARELGGSSVVSPLLPSSLSARARFTHPRARLH